MRHKDDLWGVGKLPPLARVSEPAGSCGPEPVGWGPSPVGLGGPDGPAGGLLCQAEELAGDPGAGARPEVGGAEGWGARQGEVLEAGKFLKVMQQHSLIPRYLN